MLPAKRGDTAVYHAIEDQSSITQDPDAESLKKNDFIGWPASQPRKKDWIGLSGEIALLLLPIAFIVLAICAWGFHGHRVSENGENLQRVILLGPTLFPLAFAAVGGRSMRAFALWKAEQGSTLGVLEMIHGSQSFVSATWLICSLKNLSTLSVAIIVFWLLSPLGGQSSLRLLNEVNATTTESHIVYSATPMAKSTLISTDAYTTIHRISSILSTCLSTGVTLEHSAVDTWNHPRVPRLSNLERANQLGKDEASWAPVSDQDSSYASLLGVGVTNLVDDAITTFTMPYEYLYLDCKRQLNGSQKIVKDHFNHMSEDFFKPKLERKSWNVSAPYSWQFNGTFTGGWRGGEGGLFKATYAAQTGTFYASSFFLAGSREEEDGIATRSTVFYGTKNEPKGDNVFLFGCSMYSIMVEAGVRCQSADCRVQKIRRVPQDRYGMDPPSGTTWEIVHKSVVWNNVFLPYFSTLGGQMSSDAHHPIDNYVYGNSKNGYFATTEAFFWENRSDAHISDRLTHVFNTYWDASRWLNFATTNDPFGSDSMNFTANLPYSRDLVGNNATVTYTFPTYRASIPWILTLLFCSTCLLIIGILNVVIAFRTAVPDIFGYISTLTRDNPHIDIPAGGTGIDGIKRSKLLANMKVQLGDVKPTDEVGYIALRSVDSKQAAKLTKVLEGREFE